MRLFSRWRGAGIWAQPTTLWPSSSRVFVSDIRWRHCIGTGWCGARLRIRHLISRRNYATDRTLGTHHARMFNLAKTRLGSSSSAVKHPTVSRYVVWHLPAEIKLCICKSQTSAFNQVSVTQLFLSSIQANHLGNYHSYHQVIWCH